MASRSHATAEVVVHSAIARCGPRLNTTGDVSLLRGLRRDAMEEVARVNLFRRPLDALYGRKFN